MHKLTTASRTHACELAPRHRYRPAQWRTDFPLLPQVSLNFLIRDTGCILPPLSHTGCKIMTTQNWAVICPERDAPGLWQRWLKENCVAIGWPPSRYHLSGSTNKSSWRMARERAACGEGKGARGSGHRVPVGRSDVPARCLTACAISCCVAMRGLVPGIHVPDDR